MTVAGRDVVLVPGAGSDTWYWQPVIDDLERRGHRAAGVALPSDDDGAGLATYRDRILDVCHDRHGIVLVAHSFGTFSASIAATHPSVAALVLVAPMIPTPGESAAQWWSATGHADAVGRQAALEGRQATDDPAETFFHDLPEHVVADLSRHSTNQSVRPFNDPWPLERWPDVPTRIIVGRDDRFLPLPFQRRLAAERLGLVPVDIAGGHLLPLSQPEALGGLISQFAAETSTGS